jgi:hypothetical protein
MSWKKEKKEHPWASTSTAKRIASDHAKKSKHKKRVKRNNNDPMKLIGFGVKGIVGVTALGVTTNTLSEIGKNH